MTTRRAPRTGSVFHRASDGRWIAQMTSGPRGAQRAIRRVGRTKAEAQALLRQMLTERSGGSISPAVTVGEYLSGWLAGPAADLIRPTTRRTYEIALRRQIIPAIGARPLLGLRPEHIETMLAGLGDLSPKGRRNVLAILSRILAVAERRGHLARNPAVLVERPRVPRTERPALTASDARRILAAVAGDRLEALYVVTLAAGLRQAEVLGLRWADVDLEAGIVRVAVTLKRLDGRYLLDEPKTPGSTRTVVLPPFALEALRAHRRRQLAERASAGVPTEDGLIFVTPLGRPINQGTLTHRWRTLSRAAGFDLRFHDLRHAQASLLIAAGVHPRVVAERLGHASSRMSLDRYAHVAQASDEDAAARLQSLVGAG